MVRACSIDPLARACEGGLCSDGNNSTTTTRTASLALSRTPYAWEAWPPLQCRKMKRYRRHTLPNTTEKMRECGIVDNLGKKIKKYFGAKKPTKQGVFVLLDRPPIR